MIDETETAAVRVSMRDIYLEVQRQGKMLEKIANSLPDTEDTISDHEERLRKLEQRMWQSIGAFGLLAAAMPWLVRLMP